MTLKADTTRIGDHYSVFIDGTNTHRYEICEASADLINQIRTSCRNQFASFFVFRCKVRRDATGVNAYVPVTALNPKVVTGHHFDNFKLIRHDLDVKVGKEIQ